MGPFPKFINAAFRGVILKLVILHHAKNMHPYAFLKMLKSKGGPPILRNCTKNDIYNALNSLENSGLIVYKTKKEGATIRKYYKLTPLGERVLKESQNIRDSAFKSMAKLMRGEL